MKKFLTFVFALSIVFYLSNVSIGQGKGPAVSGGHAPDINQSSSDHGKSANHATTTHDSTHSTNQQRLIDRINTDTKFSARLSALLPPGNTMTLTDLAAKFKNSGQLCAALHVGKNLDLKLEDWNKFLNAVSEGGSLGKGIQSLNLHLTQTQINVQVQTAQKQAKDDLKTTS